MAIQRTIIIFINIASILFLYSQTVAWDNEKTHKDLSHIASEHSKIGTTDILKNIGLEEGLEQALKLNGKTKQVIEWIEEGAFLEDSVSWDELITNRGRFNNHFHNPLKSWWNAGLDDYLILPSPVPPYTYTHYVFGLSSVLWAQDSTYQESFREGDQSWKKIREHYFSALTGKDFKGTVVAANKEKRDEYFARTFQGLGHQIHLIEDAAQPDHVRNDAHPEDSLLGNHYLIGPSYFETWAKKNPGIINSFASKVPDFMPQVSLNISQYGLVPITQFIDTEQYNIGTPPSTSLTWGMSEYTNSNYLSDDTIFTENFSQSDRHYFPYPRYSTQCYELYDKNIGGNKKRTYLRKKCDGETVERFAAPGPFFKHLPLSLRRLDLILDDGAHYDYASLLIPRAVGYSAGLLNYFFRGEIEAVNLETIKDGNGNITDIKMKVKNNTPNEAMSSTEQGKEGKLIVSYKYKNLSGNEVYGLSNEVLVNEVIDSGKESTSEYTFTFIKQDNSPDPIPSDAQDVKYMLVYRGKLGNEDDAVVGKEISLIPPLVFLIYQDAQNNPVYAVWSIENDGKKLVSYNYDLSPFVSKYDFYSLRYPSTLKSNNVNNKHVFNIENGRLPLLPELPQYGKVTEDGVLIGVKNSFKGDVFDYGYSSLCPGNEVICYGRNSSYIENGELIEDLQLCKIDDTSGQIKYKVAGDIRNGDVITFNNPEDIYAVLSKDKFIGLGPELPLEQTNSITTQPWPSYTCCEGYANRPNYGEGTSLIVQAGAPYKFGDVELGRGGTTSTETHGSPSFVSGKCCPVPGCEDGLRLATQQIDITHDTTLDVVLLDYDNVVDNGNPDKTFISFYKVGGGFRTVTSTIKSSALVTPIAESSYEEIVNGTRYILAYRLNGGGLHKVKICDYGLRTTTTSTGSLILGSWCEDDEVGSGTWDRTTNTSGQRINNVSGKVSDNYIVYSYILEDYVETIDGEDIFTFNKHILGIIDIETGTRTEYEVNDGLLGQYKDTFDETLASAVGLHNGR